MSPSAILGANESPRPWGPHLRRRHRAGGDGDRCAARLRSDRLGPRPPDETFRPARPGREEEVQEEAQEEVQEATLGTGEPGKPGEPGEREGPQADRLQGA